MEGGVGGGHDCSDVLDEIIDEIMGSFRAVILQYFVLDLVVMVLVST